MKIISTVLPSLLLSCLLVGCAHPEADEGTLEADSSAALTSGAMLAGHFSGAGDYRDPSMKDGPYEVKYEVDAKTIAIHYRWGGAKAGQDLILHLNFTSELEFSFAFDGAPDQGGTGYCLDRRCHLQSPNDQFEMTLSFGDASVDAVGSMAIPGGRGLWSDRATLVTR